MKKHLCNHSPETKRPLKYGLIQRLYKTSPLLRITTTKQGDSMIPVDYIWKNIKMQTVFEEEYLEKKRREDKKGTRWIEAFGTYSNSKY